MKKVGIYNEDGSGRTDNAILDDFIDLFEKQGLNNGSNDTLIKDLAIKSYYLGIMAINQVKNMGGQTKQSIDSYIDNLRIDLEARINEIKQL